MTGNGNSVSTQTNLFSNNVPDFLFLIVKFIYFENATKFCKIFPFLLTVCTVVKSKRKISQNFVAFSEYMKFTSYLCEISLFVVPSFAWLLGKQLTLTKMCNIVSF